MIPLAGPMDRIAWCGPSRRPEMARLAIVVELVHQRVERRTDMTLFDNMARIPSDPVHNVTRLIACCVPAQHAVGICRDVPQPLVFLANTRWRSSIRAEAQSSKRLQCGDIGHVV